MPTLRRSEGSPHGAPLLPGQVSAHRFVPAGSVALDEDPIGMGSPIERQPLVLDHEVAVQLGDARVEQGCVAPVGVDRVRVAERDVDDAAVGVGVLDEPTLAVQPAARSERDAHREVAAAYLVSAEVPTVTGGVETDTGTLPRRPIPAGEAVEAAVPCGHGPDLLRGVDHRVGVEQLRDLEADLDYFTPRNSTLSHLSCPPAPGRPRGSTPPPRSRRTPRLAGSRSSAFPCPLRSCPQARPWSAPSSSGLVNSRQRSRDGQ